MTITWEPTENDKSLLGRVSLKLRPGVPVIINHPGRVREETTNGEVCCPPEPFEGGADGARLALGSLIGVGPAESHAR